MRKVRAPGSLSVQRRLQPSLLPPPADCALPASPRQPQKPRVQDRTVASIAASRTCDRRVNAKQPRPRGRSADSPHAPPARARLIAQQPSMPATSLGALCNPGPPHPPTSIAPFSVLFPAHAACRLFPAPVPVPRRQPSLRRQRAKTKPSSSEFAGQPFATHALPVHAASPAAYRPGSELRPCASVRIRPSNSAPAAAPGIRSRPQFQPSPPENPEIPGNRALR